MNFKLEFITRSSEFVFLKQHYALYIQEKDSSKKSRPKTLTTKRIWLILYVSSHFNHTQSVACWIQRRDAIQKNLVFIQYTAELKAKCISLVLRYGYSTRIGVRLKHAVKSVHIWSFAVRIITVQDATCQIVL